MKINNQEVSVNDAVNFANIDQIVYKRRSNGLLLSDEQINILNNHGINYLDYSSIQDLIFDIEDILNQDYDEELDLISETLAEMHYYNDTKK